MKIKNIIFDLGGVILNIDYQLTINAFKRIGIENFDSIYTQFKQSDLFDNLETGRISPSEFISKVQEIKAVSKEEIENAWNAMLLDLPKSRVDMITELGKKYKLFLLSNTNQIHYDKYITYLNELDYVKNFNELFTKTYYSHEVGLRKPDVKIYDFVLNDQHLNSDESLFIDDLESNIAGAKKAGLKTYHHSNGEISQIIKNLL